MLAITKTAAVSGIVGIDVTVEVSITQGLPTFLISGLGDVAVKESADRVKGAIVNSGFDYPNGKILTNLSPAWVRKKGSHYDLAIAVGLLSAGKYIDQTKLENIAFIGELSLAGKIMPVNGVLPMITGLIGKVEEIFLPTDNLDEGYIATENMNIKIRQADSLLQVAEELMGYRESKYYTMKKKCEDIIFEKLDYADVKGHWEAKDAITVAVAGGHGLLMVGSPGTGKSMLARRIPSILPPLTNEEMLETSMIYSLIGQLDKKCPIIRERPIRQINCRATPATILGGGIEPVPGEISLAHNGILFMDELLEFKRADIELLRKPIEDKSITIIRKGVAYKFPANFTLITATNPCKCGYYGDKNKVCTCSKAELDKYRNKLSGPFGERIDMCIEIKRVDYSELTSHNNISSKEMKEKVDMAMEIQKERYKSYSFNLNSQMDESLIEEFCSLGKEEKAFMEKIYDYYKLSPRRYHKMLKLSRSMADIRGAKDITTDDLSNAIQYTRFFNESNK